MKTWAHIAWISLALAGASAAQATPVWIVKIGNARSDSVAVTDGAGGRAGAPPAAGEPFTSVLDIPLRQPDDALFEVEVPLDRTYTVEWRATQQPVQVDAYLKDGATVSAVHRFGPQAVAPDRRVSLQLSGGETPVLRQDADGDGTPETAIAARISLTGDAANDQTPPVLTHERLSDGRHKLLLLDGAEDLSDADHLFVSLDGRRFQGYQGPFQVDPRGGPSFFAFGEDRAGNATPVMRFDARPPFCERVQHDRSELAGAVRTGVADAVSAGALSSSSGVAVLAHGRAACLWRKGLLGGDLSCDACTGVYEPGLDAIELEVFAPDAASAAASRSLADGIAARAAEPAHALGPVSAGDHARGELDRARLELDADATHRDGGLARQLELLAWSSEGDYVDLGSAGPDVSGPSLAGIASALGARGAVPALEGHEAAQLAERELLDAGVMIRVIGAPLGSTLTEPGGDSYFASIHRRQIEAAADAALQAAAGWLATDSCAVQNTLLALGRSSAQGGRCGAAPCPGFEAAVVQRAAADTATCPSVFSNAERDSLALLARIAAREPAALQPLFEDECQANGHLAAALALVRSFRDRARPAYDEGLAAAAAPERTSRQANLAAVTAAVSARLAHPGLDLRFQIGNTSRSDFAALPVRLFENKVFTGQERRVDLATGAATILQGSAAAGRPFFLSVDAASAQVNARRDVVFVIDPDNTLGQVSDAGTFSGFSYYLFDPAHPICPAPGKVRNPLARRTASP